MKHVACLTLLIFGLVVWGLGFYWLTSDAIARSWAQVPEDLLLILLGWILRKIAISVRREILSFPNEGLQ